LDFPDYAMDVLFSTAANELAALLPKFHSTPFNAAISAWRALQAPADTTGQHGI